MNVRKELLCAVVVRTVPFAWIQTEVMNVDVLAVMQVDRTVRMVVWVCNQIIWSTEENDMPFSNEEK